MQKAASSDTTPERFMMAWELKAIAAGRKPLPTARRKRKLDEVESSESGDNPDSSTLEQDGQSAKCVGGSHSEDDKKNTTASHVAKKTKLSNAKAPRRQWSQDEIRSVVTMRRNQNSWEQIHQRFPTRTIVGIRQIFWKYNASLHLPLG
ncbi:uncharacterized protein TrAtP1_002829 [Trichoderma atroviride]|uniref:Myb-like domain-containing protein n=1 Tax=Hypocrea atroviridis (strain ATCC 20476 / IMI 206040) TaxID=452589 RepID=G9NXA1_HYPAI|nr:uncharacterized protein TRIATDRAFT_308277 [Trichoderma atroviride IMI 206040]EHK44712.1 hypothetical protein TRIATDRAFT_308277 [Trichoderma atroviride IMI 206040]UKZ61570.1 hypothetical protein TrAtP1_002829 [Trichoderma atroviride]